MKWDRRSQDLHALTWSGEFKPWEDEERTLESAARVRAGFKDLKQELQAKQVGEERTT